MKNGKLSRPAAIALIVGGDILLLILGWVLLVSPQRSTAASIAKATRATEAQIVEAQVAANAKPAAAPKQPEIKTAGLYELAKAMPSTMDMPDLLLELDQVGRAAGVAVVSITPGAAVPDTTGAAYSTIPIQLSFTGNFYSLTDLLYRLNNLVAVRDGALDATGRLFSVQSISLGPGGGGSELSATVLVDAYTYGLGAAAATTPTPTPGASTTGTDTTGTTGTTTTTASSSSDVAPNP